MNSHIIYNTDDGIIIIGMSIYSAAWRVKPVRTNIDVITNNGRLYKSFFIFQYTTIKEKFKRGVGLFSYSNTVILTDLSGVGV